MMGRSRSGFTWVELVVVLVVIGLMLALLIPAINGPGRTPWRRATCMNNQKQLALGMLNYEWSHGRFPGYVNRISQESGEEHLTASWVVPLLPQLDRNDLWKSWCQGDPQAESLDLLICPSDPPTAGGKTPLSYVVNCGLPGDSGTLADAIFFNHDVDSEPLCMTVKYLSEHDGCAVTLLLSENIQAGQWTDTSEADVGMVWRRAPLPCSKINEGHDAGDRPHDIKYARPSSRHGGIVIGSFCDGGQRTLSEDINYRVYQHLMTPDSRAAGVPGVLDESDY